MAGLEGRMVASLGRVVNLSPRRTLLREEGAKNAY